MLTVVFNDRRDRKHVYLAVTFDENEAKQLVLKEHEIDEDDCAWGPYVRPGPEMIPEVTGFLGQDNDGNDLIKRAVLIYHADYD